MALKKLLIILAITQLSLRISEGLLSAGENIEVCNTLECHQIADAFSESMNKSADPCVDFYEFTCGNWKAKDEVSKSKKYWARRKEFMHLAYERLRGELESPPTSEEILPVRQAKQFYQSCMNNNSRETNGFPYIRSIFASTNGLPMIMSNGTWNENMSWQEIDRYYMSWLSRAFYETELFCSTENGIVTSLFQVKNVPPLASKFSIKLENRTQEILYRSTIKNIAEIFIEKYGTSVSDAELERDIDDFITFEKRLVEARENADSHEETELLKKSINGGFVRLDQLITWWKNRTELIATTSRARIDWYDELQKEFAFQNISINGNTRIYLEQFGYFIELIKALESTNTRTIVNYIQLRFVISNELLPTERMRSSFNDILREISGESEGPRWYTCVATSSMKRAKLHIFTRKYGSNSTNEAIFKMINHLKRTFELQITNANITNYEIRRTKRKLNKIEFLLDYPDWVKNETALINYYEDLTISNNYFENILNYKKFTKRSHLRRCVGSIPTDVYINYGIIGYAIAHEMGHTYRGIPPAYALSRTNRILLKNDREPFRQRMERFIRFFDDYYEANNITMDSSAKLVSGPKHKTAGRLTLEENAADAIGIKVAFHAYKEMKNEELPNGELKLPRFLDYDDDRMFFISYAQKQCENPKTTLIYIEENNAGGSHPPSYSRVNALLSNTPDFADTFECKKGTPMNPINQIDVWNGPVGQTNSTKMNP